MSAAPTRRPLMGALDLGVAVLLLAGVWMALPTRWWPIDLGGTVLAILFGVAGVGLIRGAAWAPRIARIVAAIALAAGAIVATLLVVTAGNLSGLYGPVGMGGAIILAVAFVLVIPYLVVFPAAQLYFLARPEEPAKASK